MDVRWAWLLGLGLLAGCGGHPRTFFIDPNAAAAPVATSTPTAPTPPPPPPVVANLEAIAVGPGPTRVAADALEVTALAFRITNHGPAGVDLREFTVTASGRLDDAQSLSTLRLAHDTDGDGRFDRAIDRVLSSSGFATDDGDATLAIGAPLAAGGAFAGLVVVDFAGTARAGDDLQLVVGDSTKLTADALGGQVAVEGSPLAGPVLRVGDWVEPHQALTLPGDGLFPRAVRDAQGRTHLAVYQNNGSSAVFYSLFDGRNYSTPDDVSRASTAAWNQDLAVDAVGLPHVVWEQWDNALGDYAIRFSRFDPQAFTWTPSQPVSNGAGMSISPRVAVASGGDVHVVWEDHAGAPRILHRRFDGQSWSSIADVSSAASGSSPRTPAVTALQSGDVLVTWAENATGTSQIRTRRALAAGGYGSLEIAASAAGWVERPELATDSRTVHLAFVAGDEVLHTRDAGQGWSQPSNVSRSPNNGSTQPTLAIQGGALHVVWIEADPALPGLATHVAHAQTVGGAFTTPELLTRGAGDRSIPTAVGEGSRLRVLWQDWSLGRQRVFTSWREGSLLEAPRTVTATGGAPTRPSATLGALGETLVGYALDAGGNGEVFVAREGHAGLAFDLPENVSRSPTPSYRPSLATGRSAVWAAWEEDAGGFGIRVSRRDASGWSTPAAISSNVPAYAPTLAGSADRLALVWTEPGATGDHDIVLREHDGQAWGPATAIGPKSGSNAWNPDAALSDSGELAIAWEEDGVRREVMVATVTPAGTTIAAVASSTQGQFAPQVAWHDYTLHVAWLEDGRVRVAKRPAGAAVFNTPVDLNTGGAASVDLGVCAGDVVVAWEQWQGGDARVQHAVLTASGASTPAPLDLSRGPVRQVSVLGTHTSGVRVLWTDGGDVVLRERRER